MRAYEVRNGPRNHLGSLVVEAGVARGWLGGPVAGLRRRLPVLVAGGAAATVAVGLAAQARGEEWLAPLAPFLSSWEPRAAWFAVPVAGLLALAVVGAPRLVTAPSSPRAFAALSLGLALVLQLAVGVARDGPSGWYAVFDTSPEAGNEYLPALPALDFGAQVFLDRFSEVATALPVHAVGHPPGLLLVLHALGIDGARGMAALIIAVGVAAAPLTYVLARQALDERTARTATLLWIFAPSALLYGAVSADALYTTLGLVAAVAFLSRRRWSRALGPPALAVASLFSYALLAVGALAAVAVARRHGVRRAMVLAAGSALALGVFYGLLYAVSGYDPLGTLEATEQVYRNSVARIRPYSFWVFGSPVAFLVALGLPTAWYALRSLAAGQTIALALAAVIVTSAVLGFTKAETERIWLFLVPFACVAAAETLPAGRLRIVLALLAAQALAAELLLDTIW